MPLLPHSVPIFASSAISNDDHSKLAHVVTFEMPASPASLAPTAVPAKDATLSALEASFFRCVGGCFGKSRNGRRSSQCDLFLTSILATSLTLTFWTFMIPRLYWRHRQASYRIYQGLLNGGWSACLGLWSTSSEFMTTKGSVGKQIEGIYITETFVSYGRPWLFNTYGSCVSSTSHMPNRELFPYAACNCSPLSLYKGTERIGTCT